MTGGRPVAEKYLKPMTEVKNARMSTAWWLLPINALVLSGLANSRIVGHSQVTFGPNSSGGSFGRHLLLPRQVSSSF
jgi:hypothetical protein